MQTILSKWQRGEDVVLFEGDLADCIETIPDNISVTIDECELEIQKTLEKDTPQKIAKEFTNKSTDELVAENKGNSFPDLNDIKMPPKMMKRGRPKGAETTAIGLPATKKRKNKNMLPFEKLPPEEKNRFILLNLKHDQQRTVQALEGMLLLSEDNIKPFNILPDSLRDECIDIFRVEKFFTKSGWRKVLSFLKQKSKTAWTCLSCSHVVKGAKKEESILCNRCSLWCHLTCSGLKTLPKSRNWFCKGCKAKYS